jgi:hypothetical protein
MLYLLSTNRSLEIRDVNNSSYGITDTSNFATAIGQKSVGSMSPARCRSYGCMVVAAATTSHSCQRTQKLRPRYLGVLRSSGGSTSNF